MNFTTPFVLSIKFVERFFDVESFTPVDVLLNEALSLAEDAEYCARASQNWNVIVGDEHPLVHYIFNNQSAVRKFDTAYADKFLLSMKAVEEDL